MRTYQHDSASAKEADHSGGNYLSNTGKYKGVFTRAEPAVNSNGTESIEFSFEDTTGAEAQFLTIYTYRKDGTPLPGLSIINAMMTCVKAPTLTPVLQNINKYDTDKHEKVPTQATVYPELMGKPIGVVLREEEYLKGGTELKTSLKIHSVFHPETEQTATELLEKTQQPEQLAKTMEWVAANPVKKLTAQQPTAQQSGGQDVDEYFNGGGY